MSKKQKKVQHIPQTLQESIPYERVFAEGGLIEVEPGVYSKSYPLPEMNFKTANNESQWQTAEAYSKLIGSFPEGTTVEITIYNKTIDIMKFQEDILLNMKNDGWTIPGRIQCNATQQAGGAKNNLESVKVLTAAVHAEDPVEAYEKFTQIDNTVNENINIITRHGSEPMTTLERLELLNSIYNQDTAETLTPKTEHHGARGRVFLPGRMRKTGDYDKGCDRTCRDAGQEPGD